MIESEMGPRFLSGLTPNASLASTSIPLAASIRSLRCRFVMAVRLYIDDSTTSLNSKQKAGRVTVDGTGFTMQR